MSAGSPPGGPRVTVVIPVLNGWPLTARCLDALECDLRENVIAQIVVVDDGSTDETRERIVADPRVTAVLLERNHGFAGACNAGARRVPDASALLFLNNDAFARPGALGALRAALADETIGIAGPKLIYDDGTIQNGGMAFTRRGLEVLHYHLDGNLPDASTARDYPAVTGAALLIRRHLFDRLGGFDEGYTNGVEDVDLCLRAWRLGYRVRYEPAAVFIHVEGATRGRTPADNHNHARLWARSTAERRAIPAIRMPESPAYLVHTRGARSAQERAIVATLLEGLRRYGGAPTTPRAHVWDALWGRARALIERRATLSIAVGCAPHSADVLFVAPANSAEAAVAGAARVQAWWAPTTRTVERLIAAGTPPERTHLVFLGVDPPAPSPDSAQRAGVALLVDRQTIADAENVARRLAGKPLALIAVDGSSRELRLCFPAADLVSSSADPERARRLIESAEILVALAEDRYGTLVPRALASGCLVATVPDGRAAWCTEDVAILQSEAALAEQCAAVLRNRALVAKLCAAASIDAARRFPLVHGMARVRELARAQVHGPLNGADAEITPAIAARLHRESR